MKLLSRQDFKAIVLNRNQGTCCIPTCREEAVDAHHILNRNLFTGAHELGGYFLENGAGLCDEHHYQAEITLISVETLREACLVTVPAIPSQLSAEKTYDCWGNEILLNGFYARGPLFSDSGCQKALRAGGKIWNFG
jgi:hypothetical protein